MRGKKLLGMKTIVGLALLILISSPLSVLSQEVLGQTAQNETLLRENGVKGASTPTPPVYTLPPLTVVPIPVTSPAAQFMRPTTLAPLGGNGGAADPMVSVQVVHPRDASVEGQNWDVLFRALSEEMTNGGF